MGKSRIFTNFKNPFLKFVKIRDFPQFYKILKIRKPDVWI